MFNTNKSGMLGEVVIEWHIFIDNDHPKTNSAEKNFALRCQK